MADADSKEIVKSNKEIMDETAKQLPALQSIAKSTAALASNSETPEDRRERLRNENKPGKSGSTDSKPGKTGGFLSMIKGLGAGIGGIASTFLKFGGFLLKAAFFPITAISAMLTSTAALVAGLVAIGALFVGVGVASFMLTDKEFEALKLKIAEGVAGVFSTIVEGAIDFYNKFVPDSFKISDKDKKSMSASVFTTVKDGIMGIIAFAKEVTDAFAGGFMGNMKGIKLKFTEFTSKIGKVYEIVKGLLTGKGEGAKSTLMSVVTLLGDGIGMAISGILSVANFFADLIIDPEVTMAKLKAGISNGLDSMGATISEYLSAIFSKEGMLKMLQGILGPDSAAFATVEKLVGSLEDATKEASKDREKQIESIKSRNKRREVNVKEMEVALKAELDLGKKRDNATVSRLQYQLDVEKGNIETAKSTLARLGGKQKETEEILLAEKVNAAMSVRHLAMEKENLKIKRNIQALKVDKQMQGNMVNSDTEGIFNVATGIGRERFDVAVFEKMMTMVETQSKGAITAEMIAKGNAELSENMINKMVQQGFDRKDIEGSANQMTIFTDGLKKVTELNIIQAKIDTETLKLSESSKKTEIARAKIEKTILETYLPESGQILNQLERDKNSQSNGGGATVIANTDASTKQTVVNNYNGSNPEPTAKVGRGLANQ